MAKVSLLCEKAQSTKASALVVFPLAFILLADRKVTDVFAISHVVLVLARRVAVFCEVVDYLAISFVAFKPSSE